MKQTSTPTVETLSNNDSHFNKLMKPLYIGTILFLFGGISIYHYYNTGAASASHSPSFAGKGYIAWIILSLLPGILWSFYKDFSESSRRIVTGWEITIGFLWILFVTALATTTNADKAISSGIYFFFQILFYLIILGFFTYIFLGVGKKILVLVGIEEKLPNYILHGTSIILGWSSFVSMLSIIGFFGAYNKITVYSLLILAGILCYKEIWGYILLTLQSEFETGGYSLLKAPSKTINLAKKTAKETGSQNSWLFYSLFHGVFFSIFAMIVSVNFANIYRPFPIGWDDLGVYMNFPKLLATGQNISEQGLVFWQVFTGIGFLHESATFAFYLNAFGSLLAFITIWGATKYFMHASEKTGTLWKISFPLISITLFASLPMIVFQQAKDMKLDSGFLAVMIISLSLLFAAFQEKEKTIRTKLFFFAGIVTGVAFAIKLTSLILVLGAIAAIWFYRGKLLGFISFFLIFIGVFTAGRLWSFLNISYPKDAVTELNIFSLVTIISGICILFLQEKKHTINKNIPQSENTSILEEERILIKILKESIIYIAGFTIAFSPWLIKNIVETGLHHKPFTISTILNGVPVLYIPEYEKIHDTATLKKIEDTITNRDIDANGQIANEDFGRYFGYENGINNYLKLPYNLTMQVNQSGEFTDIGYIFLALIPPALYFFLSTSVGYLLYSGYLMALFVIFFTKGQAIQKLLTDFFGQINLPVGYIIIIALAFIPILIIALDKKISPEVSEEEGTRKHFSSTFIIFMSFYTLLFVVSAFGVVWYGILAYFCFIVTFALTYGKLFQKIQTDSQKEGADNSFTTNKDVRLVLALLLACIILPYFGNTVVTRAWNNIPAPQDSIDYKLGKYEENEAVFLNRPDYISTLSTINLKDPKKLDSEIRNGTNNQVLLTLFQKYPEANLTRTLAILEYAESLGTTENIPEGIAVRKEAIRLKKLAYKGILYPENDNKNDSTIYRVGTFLTYYISENRRRFFEDSLLFSFEPYLKGKTSDETAKNMRKLGIKYFLLDLNAATIDKDPKKDLTRRYEQILDFVRSDKVRLIATDSLCLQLGLELKNDPSYLLVAGANYHSYKTDEKGETRVITSDQKTLLCLQNIAQIISEKRVSEKSFPYLQNYANYLEKNNITKKEDITQALLPYIQRSWMASFEILD